MWLSDGGISTQRTQRRVEMSIRTSGFSETASDHDGWFSQTSTINEQLSTSQDVLTCPGEALRNQLYSFLHFVLTSTYLCPSPWTFEGRPHAPWGPKQSWIWAPFLVKSIRSNKSFLIQNWENMREGSEFKWLIVKSIRDNWLLSDVFVNKLKLKHKEKIKLAASDCYHGNTANKDYFL
ncbi:hypothetical protein ATANTOWER_027921 [Ataeniobius toweri]|uniref:Uncharacterized protein n=1 Tax=Ataeniobius toweri TaxID=208326 RepID=A0ABU7BV15_9TELE|nr:hypothetical protein [Ataeniobius toweri]